MIGQTVGKYRFVSKLGRGGMGTVYKAVDVTLDREVAIKVLNPDLAAADLLKRFRAEAMTLARMNHPNIGTLFELCQHDDDLLMVMELVRGESFDKLSERMGPLPVERVVYLCSQVLDALGHAHRAGIVHRDLKPANLMLSESGAVKVMDFGIARMIGSEHLTTDGYMMGTPAYMAPEQVLGTAVDGRADLYAVGVIMYRMLTGNLPFKADTAIAMVQKQINDPPTPLRRFREGLPPWCAEVLDRALAKAADDRFQTADEFRMALGRANVPAVTDQTSAMPALTPPAAANADLDITVMPNSMPTPLWVAPPPAAATTAPVSPTAPVAALPAMEAMGERPAPAAKSTRRVPAAAVAAVVILLVAGAFALVPRGSREVPPSSFAPSPAATIPAATTPAAPPSAAPDSAAPSPAASSSAALSSPAAAGTAAAGAAARSASIAAAGSPSPASESPAAVNARRGTPGPARTAASVPEPAALPPLSFEPVRLLIRAGTDRKTQEQQASLRLSDGLITVTSGSAAPLKSIPYRDVIALFYSRSKDPRWLPASGVAVPVASFDDGKFSFLKQTVRDWVIVRTRAEFVTLRPGAAIVPQVIAALEARTGLAVVRVVSKD